MWTEWSTSITPGWMKAFFSWLLRKLQWAFSYEFILCKVWKEGIFLITVGQFTCICVYIQYVFPFAKVSVALILSQVPWLPLAGQYDAVVWILRFYSQSRNFITFSQSHSLREAIATRKWLNLKATVRFLWTSLCADVTWSMILISPLLCECSC